MNRQPDDPGPDDMGIDEPHASTNGPILGIVVALAAFCVVILLLAWA